MFEPSRVTSELDRKLVPWPAEGTVGLPGPHWPALGAFGVFEPQPSIVP